MLRGNNYFANGYGKWVLLSGDWFDTLENLSGGQNIVYIRKSKQVNNRIATLSSDVSFIIPDIVAWGKVRCVWSPPHKYLESIKNVSYDLFLDFINRRIFYGWVFDKGELVPVSLSNELPI